MQSSWKDCCSSFSSLFIAYCLWKAKSSHFPSRSVSAKLPFFSLGLICVYAKMDFCWVHNAHCWSYMFLHLLYFGLLLLCSLFVGLSCWSPINFCFMVLTCNVPINGNMEGITFLPKQNGNVRGWEESTGLKFRALKRTFFSFPNQIRCVFNKHQWLPHHPLFELV